jgi:hypothetical protein
VITDKAEYYLYTQGYEKRIKRYVKDNRVTVCLVTEDQAKELDLPFPLKDLSTLPKLPRSPRSSGGGGTLDKSVYELKDNGWSRTQDVPDGEKLYVEITGATKRVVGNIQYYGIKRIVKMLEHFGKPIRVFAVRSNFAKHKQFLKQTGWKKFENFIEALDKIEVKKYNLSYGDRCDIQKLSNLFETTKDERFKTYHEIAKELDFTNDLNYSFIEVKNVTKIPELETFLKKYPMINLISRYDACNDEDKDTLIDYMNLMDSQ